MTELETFMWTKFLCVSILRVASGPRVKLASCKSALNPPVVYSTDRSKAMVAVLVLLFVALWFILQGDLLYVVPCVILFLCFSVLLVLRLPHLRKRELILVLLVCLFDLCLFGFVNFLFLLGSGKGCGLWLWHSLDFSLTFFCKFNTEVAPKTKMLEHPSLCQSRYLLLNKWAEFYQTCYITSLHGKGVQEQHYFSMRQSLHASIVCPFVCHAISS